MPDRILIRQAQCKQCSKDFLMPTIFDYCQNCNEEYKNELHTLVEFEKIKNEIKWRKRKRISYISLIYLSLFGFIGIKFGLIYELLSIAIFSIGVYAEDLVNFLCDKF
jgi:hypothetical protein